MGLLYFYIGVLIFTNAGRITSLQKAFVHRTG